MRGRTLTPFYWSQFVVAWCLSYDLSPAHGWSCNLALTGDAGQPQSLSLAQAFLHCAPEAGDNDTQLRVGVNDSLQNRSFQGVQPQVLQASQQGALLFFENANITFEAAQISYIDVGSLSDVLRFEHCQFLKFSNLTSSRSYAAGQVLHVTDSAGSGSKAGLVIEHSSFRNGTRGLSIINSTANITDTLFDSLAPATAPGGAVSVDNSDGSWLQIQSCNFTNNVATDDGGALAMTCSQCSISNSTFINNTNVDTASNGGAVSVNILSGNVEFNNCLLANNTAGLNGAVYSLHSSEGTLKFDSCAFWGNIGYQGGAISAWSVSTIIVDSCHFESNQVVYNSHQPGSGAAMYVTGYQPYTTGIYILNTVFTRNNIATSPGASIVALMQCQCVGLSNTTFQDNLGIAVTVDNTQGQCVGPNMPFQSLFDLGTVTDNSEGFLEQYTQTSPLLGNSLSVVVRNSTFSRNVDSSFLNLPDTKEAAMNLRGGAGLSMKATRSALLADVHFEGNRANSGGALLLDTCQGTIIWRGQFLNNTATHQGGAVATVNSLHVGGLVIGDSLIADNTAAVGGGVYVTDHDTITVTNDTEFRNNTAKGGGGGIACDQCEQVTVQLGSRFDKNQAYYGGACWATGCSGVTSDKAHFTGNRASVGGAVHIVSSYTSVVPLNDIADSTFLGNSAKLGGGALYFEGGLSLLNSNAFKHNSAYGFGGALAYNSKHITSAGWQPQNEWMWADLEPPPQGNQSFIRATNLSFVENFADYAGGAVFAQAMADLNMTCLNGDQIHPANGCADSSWQGNAVSKVGYGSVMAYPAAGIYLDGPQDLDYTCDGVTPIPLSGWVTDQAGTNMTGGVSNIRVKYIRSNVQVSSMPGLPANATAPKLTGQTTALADNSGRINISDMLLVAEPHVYNLSVRLQEWYTVPAAFKIVTVQPCSVGQVQEVSQPICTTCLPSTFSLDPEHYHCDACPANANCSGGAAFIPPEGSWHSGPNSTNIVECPHAAACQGNRSALLACKQVPGSCNTTTAMDADDPNSYMMRMCQEGYYGPLCSLCTLHNAPPGQARYGRTGPLQCKPCRRASTIILAYIASTLLVMLWLAFNIHVTLRQNEEDAEERGQPARVSEFLKAAQLWLQYILLLGGVNTPTPRPLHQVLSAANFAFSTVTNGSLSTDCLLSASHNSALQEIVVHLCVPLLVLLLMLLLQIIWWACTVHHQNQATTASRELGSTLSWSFKAFSLYPNKAAQLQSRMLVTCLSVLFYYYPSLLTTVLSLFACYRIDRISPGQLYPEYTQATWRHGYWLADMRFRCFTAWHLKLSAGLGTPLLVVCCVAIPLLPCLLLLPKRAEMHTPAVKLQVGFLFCNYRPRFWFWESVVLVQTLGLAAAQVFGTSLDAFYQLTIMLVILLLGTVASAYLHPYNQHSPQCIQVAAMVAVSATTLGCLMFLDDNNIVSPAGVSTIAVLLLILNIAFLVAVAWLTVKYGAKYIQAFARQGKRLVTACRAIMTASVKLVIGIAASSSVKAPCQQPSENGYWAGNDGNQATAQTHVSIQDSIVAVDSVQFKADWLLEQS